MSLTIDLLKKVDLDHHERDYWMDTVVRLKQVIYWPNFMMIRRHNEDLCDLYKSPSTVMVMKCRGLSMELGWGKRGTHIQF
jgi:hypothetical protein